MVDLGKERRKAKNLAYFTIIYNIIEGIVSIFAGTFAASIALVTFGLDSFMESLSGFVVVWRFDSSSCACDSHCDAEEARERKAVRMVGITFFIFASYVIFESSRKLYFGEKPEPSILGLVIVCVSLIVMPILYLAKQKVGKKLKSGSVLADSFQTLACMFLSAAVLAGLLLNQLMGFWQADPLVGILVGLFLVKEGWKAVTKGELCEC